MPSFILRFWNLLRSSRLRSLYERMPKEYRHSYRSFVSAPARLAWSRAPDGRRHAETILPALRNRFSGCRAILMGNGPSLRCTDWSLLRHEFTLGANRLYLLREEMGFEPSVFACVNDLVLHQFHEDISSIGTLKILDWRVGHRLLEAGPNTVFLPEVPTRRFHTDLLTGWNPGYTVSYANLQVAFYLGFQRVILIGIDHRFSAAGPSMREVVSRGPDRDHFAPDYFGEGVRWHLPNLEGSERSYRLAQRVFSAAGREILDATEGGALDVFPKTTLREALTRPGAVPVQDVPW